MAIWKTPPKAKIYEALGAIADGRVEMVDARTARVTSSGRNRTYTVTWSEDGKAIASNDNASHWQGYLGYPILAVLMVRGHLTFSPEIAARLAGVPWKRLNDEFRRDYDQAVEHVLAALDRTGGDRRQVEAEVARIMAQVTLLRLERLAPASVRQPRAGTAEPGEQRC